MQSGKRHLAILTLLLLGIAGFAASVMAADSVYRLSMGIAASEDSLYGKAAAAFAKRVEETAEGQIQVEVVYLTQPNAERDLYARITRDRIDIACLEPWAMAVQQPRLGLLAQPFLFPWPYQPRALYRGDGGKRVNELFAPGSADVVRWIEGSPALILAEKTLVQPEDMEGLRIGIANLPPDRLRAMSNAFDSLKATLVPLNNDPRQIAAALQGGVIDSLHKTPAEALAMVDQLPEAMRSGTFVLDEIPYLAVCVSKATLDKLPEELRDTFLNGLDLASTEASSVIIQANTEAESQLAAMGFAIESADTGKLSELVLQSPDPSTMGTDGQLQELVLDAKKPLAIR